MKNIQLFAVISIFLLFVATVSVSGLDVVNKVSDLVDEITSHKSKSSVATKSHTQTEVKPVKTKTNLESEAVVESKDSVKYESHVALKSQSDIKTKIDRSKEENKAHPEGFVKVKERVEKKVNKDHKVSTTSELSSEVEISDEVVQQDVSEVLESVEETETESIIKANDFATASVGHGWAISSETGAFAQLVLVEKSYTDTTTNEELVKGKGKLVLRDVGTFHLTLTSETDTTMNFAVSGNKHFADGTLKLTSVQSIDDFTVWQGTLTLDKEYTVSFATKNKKLAGELGSSVDATLAGEKSHGLWSRIWAFFR